MEEFDSLGKGVLIPYLGGHHLFEEDGSLLNLATDVVSAVIIMIDAHGGEMILGVFTEALDFFLKIGDLSACFSPTSQHIIHGRNDFSCFIKETERIYNKNQSIMKSQTVNEDSLRAHYKKLIQSEIRQLERFREQARKRSSQENVDRFDAKIHELEREKEEEDTPRYLEFRREQEEILAIQRRSQDRRSQIHEAEEQKTKMDNFYAEESRVRREERNLRYHSRREWEWLCTQDARLPDYIRSNLDKMPSNKGYIWKGIWYMGRQREDQRDRGVVIMFERPRGGSDQLIHEIKYREYHRIYKKNKHPPNTLISETIHT